MSYAGTSQQNQGPGILVLQDHSDADPEFRQMVIGARSRRIDDGAITRYADSQDYGPLTNTVFWPSAELGMAGVAWAWSAVADPVISARGPTSGTPQGQDEGGAYSLFARPATTGQAIDTRYDALAADVPEGYPIYPRNSLGIVLAGSLESQQDVHYHSTDPRLFAPHVGAEGRMGTLVADLDKGAVDLDRMARLQTGWRVVVEPDGKPNALAWNLTQNGRGDGEGGYVVDRAGGKGRSATPPPVGPTSGSPRGRSAAGTIKARTGQNLRGSTRIGANVGVPRPGSVRAAQSGGFGSLTDPGLIVAKASYNDRGPLHPGFLDDPHRIGQDKDGNPVNPVHIDVTALFVDPIRPDHDGPLDYSWTALKGDRGEYPVEVNFGWINVEQAFGWNSWSPEEVVIPQIRVPDGPRSGTPRPPKFPPKQGGTSQMSVPRIHTQRWMESTFASQSYRAQRWGEGLPDRIHERRELDDDATGPIVLRGETFASQTGGLGGPFNYDTLPDQPPYVGGTADGGYWLMAPAYTGQDYGNGDFDVGARSVSSAVFGIGPGVSLAFGRPDIETGGAVGATAKANAAGQIEVTDPVSGTFPLAPATAGLIDGLLSVASLPSPAAVDTTTRYGGFRLSGVNNQIAINAQQPLGSGYSGQDIVVDIEFLLAQTENVNDAFSLSVTLFADRDQAVISQNAAPFAPPPISIGSAVALNTRHRVSVQVPVGAFPGVPVPGDQLSAVIELLGSGTITTAIVTGGNFRLA